MPTGPKPKADAKRPEQRRHPVTPAEKGGWQHGEIPEPPGQLCAESLEVWGTWFAAWWASFWKPEDVPQLRLVITLFDKTTRGELDPSKLTPYLDRFGLTPKGRQDLRWAPPEAPPAPAPAVEDELGKKREGRKLA